MEFEFLNEIFENPITKLNYTLLPENFVGSEREKHDISVQIADIIDRMGVASAKSQDLPKPITSSKKLGDGDHLLYLMVDHKDINGRGSVVGLLKVAVKKLFLFDRTGKVHEKQSLCVLDFYVHESKQRQGYGKQLFEYMLRDKKIEPCKLALDKPSNKFLSFLKKYYGQSKIYPQNNNFLVFEGFFNETAGISESSSSRGSEEFRNVSKSGMSTGEQNNQCIESVDYCPVVHGRHTAYKPHDTIEKESGAQNNGRQADPNQHTVLW